LGNSEEYVYIIGKREMNMRKKRMIIKKRMIKGKAIGRKHIGKVEGKILHYFLVSNTKRRGSDHLH
jgi:hypothetical protein